MTRRPRCSGLKSTRCGGQRTERGSFSERHTDLRVAAAPNEVFTSNRLYLRSHRGMAQGTLDGPKRIHRIVPGAPSGTMSVIRVRSRLGGFPELQGFVCYECLEVLTVEASSLSNELVVA
jgi:hypothetical protein